MNVAEAPKIDFKELRLSSHASFRMKQRFEKMTKENKLHTCRCILGASYYLGYSRADEGKFSHMFSDGTHTIHIGDDLKTIVSIYKSGKKGYIVDLEPDNPLYVKLKKLYQSEYNRFERTEKAKERKLMDLKYIAEIEKAQLKYKIHRTKSEKVRNECSNKISDIESNIINMEAEIKKLQDDKRKIAKAMACIV